MQKNIQSYKSYYEALSILRYPIHLLAEAILKRMSKLQHNNS